MADGNITVEVRTQAAQAELDRLRADNAALRREAHTWWTAARDAMKLREPLAPEVIEAAAAEAFGYEGGLQEVNLGDLLHFARTLEQRHGIGPNVAGNRLAEGKSELTGLLGGPTRSEKD